MASTFNFNGWFKTKGWPTPVIPEAFDVWIFWFTCADEKTSPMKPVFGQAAGAGVRWHPCFQLLESCRVKGDLQNWSLRLVRSNSASRTFQRCIFCFGLQLWKKLEGVFSSFRTNFNYIIQQSDNECSPPSTSTSVRSWINSTSVSSSTNCHSSPPSLGSDRRKDLKAQRILRSQGELWTAPVSVYI